MTDNDGKQPAPLPWHWRIALARILLAVVLAFSGFVWAAWLAITDRESEALLWAGAIMVCARVLAGGLYGYRG